MRQSRAGHRYALAILQLAEELNKLEKITTDFQTIENILKSSRDFLLFLRSPIINTEKKKKIINQIFEGKVDELTLKFLLLLTSKNREELIPVIIINFWNLLYEKNGIINAEVSTVVNPTQEQIDRLKKQLEKLTKRKVMLELKNVPELIGGYKIKVQDTVYDGSILNQFNILKKKFLEAGTQLKMKTK